MKLGKQILYAYNSIFMTSLDIFQKHFNSSTIQVVNKFIFVILLHIHMKNNHLSNRRVLIQHQIQKSFKIFSAIFSVCFSGN